MAEPELLRRVNDLEARVRRLKMLRGGSGGFWTPLELMNGWEAYEPSVYGEPGYMRDKHGMVHLVGRIWRPEGLPTWAPRWINVQYGHESTHLSGPDDERIAFRLPEGYRPATATQADSIPPPEAVSWQTMYTNDGSTMSGLDPVTGTWSVESPSGWTDPPAIYNNDTGGAAVRVLDVAANENVRITCRMLNARNAGLAVYSGTTQRGRFEYAHVNTTFGTRAAWSEFNAERNQRGWNAFISSSTFSLGVSWVRLTYLGGDYAIGQFWEPGTTPETSSPYASRAISWDGKAAARLALWSDFGDGNYKAFDDITVEVAEIEQPTNRALYWGPVWPAYIHSKGNPAEAGNTLDPGPFAYEGRNFHRVLAAHGSITANDWDYSQQASAEPNPPGGWGVFWKEGYNRHGFEGFEAAGWNTNWATLDPFFYNGWPPGTNFGFRLYECRFLAEN